MDESQCDVVREDEGGDSSVSASTSLSCLHDRSAVIGKAAQAFMVMMSGVGGGCGRFRK